jgi:hypothetical protein
MKMPFHGNCDLTVNKLLEKKLKWKLNSILMQRRRRKNGKSIGHKHLPACI